MDEDKIRQSPDKDSRFVFTRTRAFLFQELVHELLQSLGYKVRPNVRVGDKHVDFIVSSSETSSKGTANEPLWITEVKYRNFTVGIDILYQLVAFAQDINAGKLLLVINSTLTRKAMEYASKKDELEIWDGYKLLALLEQFPQLKQKYSEVIPRMDKPIDETELVSKAPDSQHELVKELRTLPPGDGKPYEELVKRILEFCFHDEFFPFEVKEQVKTLNEKRIRDFIINNRNSKDQFWKDLKWVRKVEKILIDAKNYKEPVKYRDIVDTLRYLKNEAFGKFIIIISRQGIQEYVEAVEDFVHNKQIALFLSDEDLVKMINLKLEGNSPTLLVENRYYEFLDMF